jgi:hypothetical protein
VSGRVFNPFGFITARSTNVVVNSMCVNVRLAPFDSSLNANTNVIVNKANDHGPGSLIYQFL